MVQKLAQECTEKVPKPKHDIWISSPHRDLKNVTVPGQKDQFWLKCFHLRFNTGCYHKYCSLNNTCKVRKTSTAFFRRYNTQAGWSLIENYFSLFNRQHVAHCIRKQKWEGFAINASSCKCLKRLFCRYLTDFVSLHNTILSKRLIFKTLNVCHRSACIFWSHVK